MPTTFNEGYPHQYESWLTLKNGREVFLRPILETDQPLLVDLFNKLSYNSKRLRFLGYFSALSEDMLFHFTHVDYDSTFALVGIIKEDGKDAIIAVGRYAYDPDEHTTDLAIVVRDDWQHHGLGKSILVKIISIGKRHGIPRFVSLIDPENSIIKKILSEIGYEVKYSLKSGSIIAEILV
jgi:acetyltransferase